MDMMGRFQMNFMALISDLEASRCCVCREGPTFLFVNEASMLGMKDPSRLRISAGILTLLLFSVKMMSRFCELRCDFCYPAENKCESILATRTFEQDWWLYEFLGLVVGLSLSKMTKNHKVEQEHIYSLHEPFVTVLQSLYICLCFFVF